jgi:4'-phosphopantetheinyl transferase
VQLFSFAGEVPAGDSWLSPAEREVQAALRVPKRRADWRLGRFAAKHAVAIRLGGDPAEVEVRAASDGAPDAYRNGMLLPVAISISHRDGRAICAVADEDVALGCDLELIESREGVFVADFFTESERHAVAKAKAQERDALIALIWSAKESVLKAKREGLRIDTRDIEVESPEVPGAGWTPVGLRARDGKAFYGWARRDDDYAITVAADRRVDAPPVIRCEESDNMCHLAHSGPRG